MRHALALAVLVGCGSGSEDSTTPLTGDPTPTAAATTATSGSATGTATGSGGTGTGTGTGSSLADGLLFYMPFDGSLDEEAQGVMVQDATSMEVWDADPWGNPDSALGPGGCARYYDAIPELFTFSIAMWVRPADDFGTDTATTGPYEPPTGPYEPPGPLPAILTGGTFSVFAWGPWQWKHSQGQWSLEVYQNSPREPWFYELDGHEVADEWIHLAATVDVVGEDVRLYRDGVEVASDVDTPASIQAYTGEIWVGCTFAGAIDEHRVYDRVLTAQEVAQLASVP